MAGMKDVGALLLSLGKGSEDKPREDPEGEDASPDEMLEDALGMFADALKSRDTKSAARAFRLALDVCGCTSAEDDGGEMENESEAA